MDKEIFIAFATQKGGIGKTTLTVLTASYLHYVKGYNVAVVDMSDFEPRRTASPTCGRGRSRSSARVPISRLSPATTSGG